MFVHGLQGHPFKTWASSKVPKSRQSRQASSTAFRSAENEIPKKSWKEKLRRIVSHRAKHSSEDRRNGAVAVVESRVRGKDVEVKTLVDAQDVIDDSSSPCFWPKDLLPRECSKTRVLTWGYDTQVTRYFNGASNKNNVLSHGKDLLFGLGRARGTARPIIFVAHSLGGIVVKEVSSKHKNVKYVRQLLTRDPRCSPPLMFLVTSSFETSSGQPPPSYSSVRLIGEAWTWPGLGKWRVKLPALSEWIPAQRR